MLTELLGGHVFLEVHGADGALLHGYLLQLPGEGRLRICVLWRDGLVAGLLQRFLVRRAVLLRQRDVVGAVVLLGGSHHVGFRQALDTFYLVEHILPGAAFREGHHQLLRTSVDGLYFPFCLHHHLALQRFYLLVAEVAVHHLLYLFHHAAFCRFHLTQQVGNDGDASACRIVETDTHGGSHHEFVLVGQRVQQSGLFVEQQFVG